jgi:hypothetical protein
MAQVVEGVIMKLTIEKAPGACDTEGFHTDTINLNSATSGAPSKALAVPAAPLPSRAAILAALEVLFMTGDVIELRALTKGRKHTVAGYFDSENWDSLAEHAALLSSQGAAVYITLNPVDPQLLNRYSNRVEANASATTNDKQVVRRRWLLIDLDPVRPTGTSATNAQLDAAKVKAREIHRFLVGLGWPAPLTALSGNGYHLLCAIDLPNDAASSVIVKTVLIALGERFDDAHTKVDRSVFNAARICKLYGTVANKGDHTATAPWRLSCLLDTPARIAVSVQQMEMLQPSDPLALPRHCTPPAGSFALEDFLAQHGISYTTDHHEGRERFKLASCPFNSEHVNGEAAVLRKPSGELGFKCQHDSCASNHWRDVRALLDGPQPFHLGAAPFDIALALDTDNASQDETNLRQAIASIPGTASLGAHPASQVIGMALRHVSSGLVDSIGRALCAEWDALTGGTAQAVFDKSDPLYSARSPLGLKSIFKLARVYGWTELQPSNEAWADPTPLPGGLPPVMPFNEDLLPLALRPWVMDIAHRMQCPADFPAVTALVALSSLIGARAVVQPKAKDTWQVVPNLWGVVVGRPGVKKSPALGEALKPLNKLQENEFEALKLAHEAWELDCKVAEMQGEANQRTAKSLAAKNPSAARALLAPVPIPVEPLARRYIVNDATVEKLGELLQQNPWGTLSYRDELYGLLTSLDKPGQEGSRAFYLQSYDGNQGYTFDRIGRGTVQIPRVCLAMIGGIQPGRIQDYVRGAVAGGSADDGLLQRFGLAVWPDVNGKFIHVDQWPDTPAKQLALDVFERLAALKPASDTEPEVWRFDDTAQALFVEWLVPFEIELRGEELHPAMVSHLSKYRKLIPALALVFAMIDTPESGGLIHEAELMRALAMGEYLRSHATRLYAAAMMPETGTAASLLSKIKAGKLVDGSGPVLSSFTAREVAVKHWTGLCTTAVARKAADVLVEYGYLRRETEPVGSAGGRPSERYIINPLVLVGDAA